MAGTSIIDSGLRRFTGSQRAALAATVNTLRELLPTATEAVTYGLPTLMIDGIGVFAVEGFAKHNSLFPMSGSLPQQLSPQLRGYTISKGTIQFPLDKPIPRTLLRTIVKAKIAEVNAGYPKRNGEFKEFYDNGVLKASGRMRDGALVGEWSWYRRDGSVMRTGAFTAGAQTGEWVTYAADGRVVKRTQFDGAAVHKPSAKGSPARKVPASKPAPRKSPAKKATRT